MIYVACRIHDNKPLRLLALCGLRTLRIRWERPSGVSKNYASRLADLSRPSGSSSTIYKTKIESSNCIGQNYPSRNIG